MIITRSVCEYLSQCNQQNWIDFYQTSIANRLCGNKWNKQIVK